MTDEQEKLWWRGVTFDLPPLTDDDVFAQVAALFGLPPHLAGSPPA